MNATRNSDPVKRCVFPCRELFPFVDRYWSWEGPLSQIPTLPELLPGTGKELVFHYADPFLHPDKSGQMRQTSAAHLICLRKNVVKLIPGGRTGFFAVRFRAGALRHFCPVPLSEIVDPAAPLPDALHFFGTDVEALCARLFDAGTFARRAALAEGWLLRRLRERSPRDAAIDRAALMLYYGAAAHPADAAAGIGLGPRQFQRDFKAALGLRPKTFLRLSRLQRVIRTLLLGNDEGLLDAALAGGYYDQPHFIREFKEFTNETPSSFFHRDRPVTHFYNTSRPENRILSVANPA